MAESNVRKILDPELAYRRWVIERNSRPRLAEEYDERHTFTAGWKAAVDALAAVGEVLQDAVDG